jgi:hypothetical protein
MRHGGLWTLEELQKEGAVKGPMCAQKRTRHGCSVEKCSSYSQLSGLEDVGLNDFIHWKWR